MAKAKVIEALVDTNSALDIFIPNRPITPAQLQASKDVWKVNDQHKIVAYMTASSLTDLFYIAERQTNTNLARQAVRTCLKSLRICTVAYRILSYADSLPGLDFEDNVQIACALRYNIGIIITRDQKFFKGLVPVLSPEQLLKQI